MTIDDIQENGVQADYPLPVGWEVRGPFFEGSFDYFVLVHDTFHAEYIGALSADDVLFDLNRHTTLDSDDARQIIDHLRIRRLVS
jgi:hypothetical protein